MSNVIPMDDAIREVSRRARELLERAESGEVRSVAIITVSKDGKVGTAFYDSDPFTLLGGLDYLKHRILTEQIEPVT